MNSQQTKTNKMQQTEELRACRACLSTHGELHELKEGLLEKFQQVTSLRVCPIAGIPKHICSFCRALLIKTYDFRLKCLQSDQIILQKTRSLNCTWHVKEVSMMHELSLTDVSVAFGGKNEYGKDLDHVDCHEVVVKEEHAEIDSFQNFDGYFVDEAVHLNNEVNSNDESHKWNTSNHAHHDVNIVDPTMVIKTECNIKNEVFEISPKNEFDRGFIECVDSHKTFSEETIHNTQVDLLEKVNDNVNAIDIDNAINSKCKISTILNVKRPIAPNESDSNYCKKAPLRTRKYSFGCDICGKMFKSKCNIRDHITTVHSVVRPYSCEQCGKAFKSLGTLNHHQRVHTAERHFSCDSCGKMFKSNNEVRRHTRLVHSEARPHACEQCGKAFKSLGTLKDHERVHTVKRPFNCDICSKTFKSKAEVQRHTKQVHNQARPYPCEECGMAFMLPYKLKIHQQVHTGVRSFVCGICSKMFRTKYEVQRHTRQVHGVAPAPFPCMQCDKTFTFESNLKSHQLEHTGERPFSCDVCSKMFKSANEVRKHSRQVHREDARKVARPSNCQAT